MKRSLVLDSLRRIQDIVAEATGAQLHGASEKRLERVLAGLAGEETPASSGDSSSHRLVTILLADLRGFTAISATYPGSVVLELLNRCFAGMSDIIVEHGGTIDKFMGDAIMVVFSGDPLSPGDHVKRALLCAVEMQIAMNQLRQRHKDEGLPEMYMGIGINTGEVVAGLIGSDVYRAYTVIGEEVNLASRIEAFSLRGQVLISQATLAHCGEFATMGEPMEVYVKGRQDRVTIREVLAIPSVGRVVPRQEQRRSPRIKVTLPFSYQLLQRKIVLPGAARGTVHDIGYHGVLAELDRAVPLHAEIKLDLELPLVAYRAADIYARIVKIIATGERELAGIEFTSLSPQSNQKLQLFVQMLIQGLG